MMPRVLELANEFCNQLGTLIDQDLEATYPPDQGKLSPRATFNVQVANRSIKLRLSESTLSEWASVDQQARQRIVQLFADGLGSVYVPYLDAGDQLLSWCCSRVLGETS